MVVTQLLRVVVLSSVEFLVLFDDTLGGVLEQVHFADPEGDYRVLGCS